MLDGIKVEMSVRVAASKLAKVENRKYYRLLCLVALESLELTANKTRHFLLASDSDCSGNSVMPQKLLNSPTEFGIGEKCAVENSPRSQRGIGDIFESPRIY